MVYSTGSVHLTEPRRKEIMKLLNDRYKIETNENLLIFTSKYTDCEATARKLVGYYKSDRGLPVSKSMRPLKLIDIMKAAEHYGLPVTEEEIRLIFDSEGTRGRKSPRQLKMALLAIKAPNDMEEIIWRSTELSAYMDKWIRAIKSTTKLNS
ncbi:hypothetical protein [Youngiibacter fragilis]|uniref:Uncharacterized protein n=1 Tax=Youngiibacter fragilis 232.1 TaxID=994573 RepID=V7IC85_9CLOT|nr:hypothetical protein [Youngiibacter fragilis]ETA82482.1 hypothetical protein T472_0200920 [Youngiibacter fragilis 232.1]